MKEILEFLRHLSQNNSREWMLENKATYDLCRNVFQKFVEELILVLGEVDPDMVGLTAKDCTFRINRDVRFSKDKRPYKENFSAYFCKGGKKSMGAGYYLHLQSGASFLGGGMYNPPSPQLAMIRQEIDYNATVLHGILREPKFKEEFGEISGDRLKTSPKGYPADHPDIELLKLKSFVVMKSLKDAEVCEKNFSHHVKEAFSLMKPFKDYLNLATME